MQVSWYGVFIKLGLGQIGDNLPFFQEKGITKDSHGQLAGFIGD